VSASGGAKQKYFENLDIMFMKTNLTKVASLAAFILLAAPAQGVFAATGPQSNAAVAPVGVNLLTNPGHEHPGAYFAGRGEINVTWNWVPFWMEPPPGTDLRDQNYRTPEFRPPFASQYPDRVKSGSGSDRWFNYFALNKASGVMQVVKDLPAGKPIRFTTYMQLWSSQDDAQPVSSIHDGNLLVRLCIMQGGGPRDMTSPLLTCSDWAQPYDKWAQLTVDGTALNTEVLVFAQTTASLPVQHNDAYMDESCFEVLPSVGAAGICKGAGLIETGTSKAITPGLPEAKYIKNANVGTIADPARRQPTPEEAQMLKGILPKASTSSTAPTTPVTSKVVVTAVSGTAKNATGNNIRVRGGAGTTYAILGTLKPGEAVNVTGTTNTGWLQVSYNGKAGYVLAALTDFKK
jgi:hypothetical protein